DNELLSLFQSGNEEAITAIKDKYHHYLYKISYQILGDNEDVEECLNDAWLAAWKAIPKDVPEKLLPYLRKSEGKVRSSLFRIRKKLKTYLNQEGFDI
nr:hypothetical protein [Lachnospiraceae bacterium]